MTLRRARPAEPMLAKPGPLPTSLDLRFEPTGARFRAIIRGGDQYRVRSEADYGSRERDVARLSGRSWLVNVPHRNGSLIPSHCSLAKRPGGRGAATRVRTWLCRSMRHGIA